MMDPLLSMPPSVDATPAVGAPLNDLMTLLYAELRRVAHRHLLHERSDHPLQTTALVHEAYLRLARSPVTGFNNRAHCLAAASLAMRRILLETARSASRQKRGGGWGRVSLDLLSGDEPSRDVDIVALAESLERLAAKDSRKAQIVEMRFFGGMTEEEIAEVLNVTVRTVERDWRFARAWLYRDLTDHSPACESDADGDEENLPG